MTCTPITFEDGSTVIDPFVVLLMALRVLIEWLMGNTYDTWVFEFLSGCTFS